MLRRGFLIIIFLLAPALMMCSGGGGGNGGPPQDDGEIDYILVWEQPLTFADNTALDPLLDIDRYDIYINDSGIFTEEDEPVATVAAVHDVVLGETYITEPLDYFDLKLLEPFGIGPGHWVSVRSVGLDNNASKFSDPVLWGNIPTGGMQE